MRNFTQTLKFLFLACALTLAATPAWPSTVNSTSGDHSKDIKDGKVVLKGHGNHVTFTLAGMDIKYKERFGARNIDAYDLGAVDWNSSQFVTLSWEVESGYSIKVTKIAFWARAYTSADWYTSQGQVVFNGTTKSAGTIWVRENDDEWAKFSETKSTGFSNNMKIQCKNALNDWYNTAYTYDYMIKNLQIIYTITPIIETKNESVEITLCADHRHTLDLNTCITNKKDHLTYSYEWKDENGVTQTSSTFSATKIGTYPVKVSVSTATDCHVSASANFTVNVTPATLILTAPTASAIKKGQSLNDSDLSGGLATVSGCGEVEGTWAWKDPSITPPAGDDQPYTVVFTPTFNPGNYSNTSKETTAFVDVKNEFIFDGSGDGSMGDEKKVNWCKPDNWQDDELPTIADAVLIRHDVVIACEVSAYSVEIESGKTVTIAPTGGLTVGAGGIIGASAETFTLQADTIDAKGKTGYLRISPEYTGEMPQATVELFSIGYYDKTSKEENIASWQCLGAPIADENVLAKSVYNQSWVYSWDEENDGWVNNRRELKFTPFKGFETTQYKKPNGVLLTHTGTLVSVADPKTIDLACTSAEKGYNLLANSFTAPIAISQFQSGDFENAAQTIFILNAGTKAESDTPGEGMDAPGKFIGIPIKTAEALAAEGYPTIIPSMQGFWIKAINPLESKHQLKLDYSRLVWLEGATYNAWQKNKPLRAPQSEEPEETSITGTLKVSISANGWTDFFYMLESESYDVAYEDGYDAHKIPSGDMDIFTIRDNDQLGVDATSSIVGTRVGVRTGDETEYTFRFSHLQTEKDLVLWDKETRMKIYINESSEYTFFAVPNSTITERFEIIEANIPTVTTGVDEIQSETHIRKFIKDSQLYILKDGVLYNANGTVVRK